MYNRDIKMLAHLNKMDQTFKQISFAFLNDRTLDDFHNRIRFDLHEFKEFYAQTLIDVLTVKAYLEADGKESYLTPIKADIQLLHTFANQCFKWIDAVEQLMNIENDVLKKNNWKLPLSKADLITVDRKATTPFSFVEHYAHLSYLDKEKAVFFHLAMDNGIILNKLKQVIVVCHNEITNYMDYLSVAAQKSCLSHVQENKNNKQANLEIGYYLYREIIDFDDIHIKPEMVVRVVKNAS